MPRNWIRRNTTANDLLDDGVENFSDVTVTQADAAEEGTPDPLVLDAKQRTRDAAKRDAQEKRARERRLAWSPFGVCVGLTMIGAGGFVLIRPADMLMYHRAWTYWWRRPRHWFVEHVTPDSAMFYGGVLVAAGVAVLAVALLRSRRR